MRNRTCEVCGNLSDERVCEECEDALEQVNSSVMNRFLHTLDKPDRRMLRRMEFDDEDNT